MTAIVGLRGLTLDPGGNDVFEKDADTVQPPASMAKVITAWTARQWITDLQATLTMLPTDNIGRGSTAGLLAGDVLTYEDAFYGMMLPSGNDAATGIGRTVGDMIAAQLGGTGGLARFRLEMVAQMDALGLTDTVWADTTGGSAINSITMRQVCELVRHIDANDKWLRTVMGTLDYTITITGTNARTINVSHTIDPTGTVKLPEFVAGKTGTTDSAGACVVTLWDDDGGRYVSGVMGSDYTDRFPDLRAIMDHAQDATGRKATGLYTPGPTPASTTARWAVA